MTIRSARAVVPSGPTTDNTEFCPSMEFAIPSYGSLPVDGRMPYSPLKAAGIRMEPPISVPNPTGAPFSPINAPSPPELPPDDRFRFFGFHVYSMMLFTVSPHISVCGTLVLQYSIAPSARSSFTISLSNTFSLPVPLFPSNVPIQPT